MTVPSPSPPRPPPLSLALGTSSAQLFWATRFSVNDILTDQLNFTSPLSFDALSVDTSPHPTPAVAPAPPPLLSKSKQRHTITVVFAGRCNTAHQVSD
ncbi:hypothetical protein BCR44DRAFT_161862 [Catenaria anguillulae PL171]|uniref:Uncharacterized protein n=1 Tax=Catenaria anguillulae PL171 TaxID=765915 RepID=A0A1Y2HWP3_9FUNG|nr:hypothetical protein BCR44DRAFT_161862 [Catenaria anguillulae PL171]